MREFTATHSSVPKEKAATLGKITRSPFGWNAHYLVIIQNLSGHLLR